jgi:hypothetical protein
MTGTVEILLAASAKPDSWEVRVVVPYRLPSEELEALFDAVADAAHNWEPEDRDGWDMDISAGPTHLNDTVKTQRERRDEDAIEKRGGHASPARPIRQADLPKVPAGPGQGAIPKPAIEEAITAWLDNEEASTVAWEKTHNPDCGCEVAYTTFNNIRDLRQVIDNATEEAK